MSDDKKADLEERIEENLRKIEELNLFRDDPKIDKIIRALQRQIARDSFVGIDHPAIDCASNSMGWSRVWPGPLRRLRK
jgi:hypothetical protein